MAGIKHLLSWLPLVWQAPLALLSYMAHFFVRSLVIYIGVRHYRSNAKSFMRWQFLSRDTLQKPNVLSRYMAVGPRWNTHAAIASAGPFAVAGILTVDVEPMAKSAGYWAFAIKQFPSFQGDEQFSSLTHTDAGSPVTLQLPQGDYSFSLRYYLCSEQIKTPTIKIDGKTVAGSVVVSGDVNEFYQDLFQQGRFFYFCLNYYVYVLVKWRAILPKSWVRRELLPVGNIETEFYYGILKRNQALTYHLKPELFENHRVYFTAYNKASFPILYYEVTQPQYTGLPCNQDCIYLVRIVQVSPGERALPLDKTALKIVLNRQA